MPSATAVTIEANGVRAVFERAGDRWHHRLEVQSGGGWALLLESIEGDAHDACPPTPPLQELQSHGGRTRQPSLLGIGMTHGAHWSLSCDPLPEGLRFAYACRTRRPFQRLGNLYRTAAPATVAWRSGELLVATGGAACTIRAEEPGTLHADEDQVAVQLHPAANPSAPPTAATWNWSYWLRRLEPS